MTAITKFGRLGDPHYWVPRGVAVDARRKLTLFPEDATAGRASSGKAALVVRAGGLSDGPKNKMLHMDADAIGDMAYPRSRS
jgi:hypothetical protein